MNKVTRVFCCFFLFYHKMGKLLLDNHTKRTVLKYIKYYGGGYGKNMP